MNFCPVCERSTRWGVLISIFYQVSSKIVLEKRFFTLSHTAKKFSLFHVARFSPKWDYLWADGQNTNALEWSIWAAHERQAGSSWSGTLVTAAIALPRHPSDSLPSRASDVFSHFPSPVGQHNASRGISRVYKINPLIVAQQSMLEWEGRAEGERERVARPWLDA